MSFTETRADLAAALSTVDGVTGYEKQPEITVLAPGDAYALLGSADRGPGQAWSATWRVIVVLGGDAYVAMVKIDEWRDPVVDALQPLVYVKGPWTPLQIDTSAGKLFAIELLVESE